MMASIKPTSHTGSLMAGKLTGGALLAASGLFSHIRGARAQTTTHATPQRAPRLVVDARLHQEVSK